jgi:hypothetical protein
MLPPEPENSCVITWNPEELTLDGLAKFVSLLIELHSKVAVPYTIEELYPDSNVIELAPLKVASMHMGSPLITELLSGPSAIDITALGMVGYALKYPERLGGFLERVRTGRDRAERERIIERYKLIETRSRIEARGCSIERFESRELERARRKRDRGTRSEPDQTRRDGRDHRGRDSR